MAKVEQNDDQKTFFTKISEVYNYSSNKKKEAHEHKTTSGQHKFTLSATSRPRVRDKSSKTDAYRVWLDRRLKVICKKCSFGST